MKRILGTVFVFLALFLGSFGTVSASSEAGSSAAFTVPITKVKKDARVERLNKFLSSFDSPLASYSASMVKTADKYNIDWKLIPAISGVESTFGKAIPNGSYNAYGWVNGNYYFKSWEDSFETVAKTLRENYFNRGADTVEKIAPIYAPPSNTWAGKVNYFMEKITDSSASDTSDLELSL